MPGARAWLLDQTALYHRLHLEPESQRRLDIPDLIARTLDIYEFPLVDRDPVDRWSFGRVTLIGDAAHPDPRPLSTRELSQLLCWRRLILRKPCSATTTSADRR